MVYFTFPIFRRDEKKAILWAKKLFEALNIGNPSEEKPTTLVYRLVERLNDFKK